jgi:hypothetical protein
VLVVQPDLRVKRVLTERRERREQRDLRDRRATLVLPAPMVLRVQRELLV